MVDSAVSVRGLGAHAGNAAILLDVSFDVAAGEVITLFGPSGAGKTTIASAIAGIDSPGVEVTGEVLVDGRSGAGPAVGYLPQNSAATLNPARRIGNALGELVDLHHGGTAGRSERKALRRARIARILGMAAFDVADDELDRMLRKYPFEFSGGQRTRLALAQVLATDPSVIVLDEPTTGLDSLNRAKLIDQLDVLRNEGIAIVLVTHDPFVAERLSDNTLHVREGRIVAEDDLPPAVVPRHTAESAHGAGIAAELRGVSVHQHRTPILSEVDIELADGETLGIIGVSGAGKSTIARCLAGLLTPDRGSVLVGGEPFPEMRKRSRSQIAHLQYIGQESAWSFDQRRPVADQVAATAVRLRGQRPGDARREALSMLAEMGLDEVQAHRYPPGLSGGQLQRAAVARALMAHPRVLICDEVTTGLDRPLSGQILDHIESYRRDTGASVISISHDLRSQLDRADRIAIVDRGRLVETGTPAGLLAAPETPVLRELLAAEEVTATR
jgi:peptide/nickel transport system ATP-binding protein